MTAFLRSSGRDDGPPASSDQRGVAIALLAWLPTAVAASWLPDVVTALLPVVPDVLRTMLPVTAAETAPLLVWTLAITAPGDAPNPDRVTALLARLP
jgi:hypothetical protein